MSAPTSLCRGLPAAQPGVWERQAMHASGVSSVDAQSCETRERATVYIMSIAV